MLFSMQIDVGKKTDQIMMITTAAYGLCTIPSAFNI